MKGMDKFHIMSFLISRRMNENSICQRNLNTREVQVNREVQTGIQVGRHTNRHVYRWTGIQIRDAFSTDKRCTRSSG